MPKRSLQNNRDDAKRQKLNNSVPEQNNSVKFHFTPSEFLRKKIHIGDSNV